MAELKLNIIVDNLNKLKKQLEGINFGKSNSNNNKSSGPSSLGIGASVALLTELVKSTQSIQALLKIIGTLIDRLVTPFIPILLTIIKPVFLLLEMFLSKVLESFGKGESDANISGFEKVTKYILLAISGIGTAIVAAVAGIPGSLAVGLGLLVAGLSLLAFDFGKKLGKWAIDFGMKLGSWLISLGIKLAKFNEYLRTKLFEAVGYIYNIFIKSFNSLSEILSSVWKSLYKVLTDSWSLLKSIISNSYSYLTDTLYKMWDMLSIVFEDSWSYLKNILSSVWKSLIGVFEDSWGWLKNAFLNIVNSLIDVANFFISGFTKGLNGLISLLNQVPGVNISDVKSKTIEPIKSNETNINITIEGSADVKTVDAVISKLRTELSRRAAF